MTGNRLDETAVSGSHGTSQNFTTVASTIYTFSCYAKAGERTQLRIGTSGGQNTLWLTSVTPQAYFDLVTGAITGATSGTTATIQKLPDGWWRCAVSAQTSALSGLSGMGVYAAIDGVSTYMGEVGKGLYVWGKQNENAGFTTGATNVPSSYIPTTTVAVTRNVDLISLPSTSFPFSISFVSSMVDFTPNFIDGDAVMYNSVKFYGSSIVYYNMNLNTTASRTGVITVNHRGAQLIAIESGNVANVSGVRQRVAASYDPLVFRAAFNGTKIGSDMASSTPSLPTINTVHFGCNESGTAAIMGHLHKFTHVPRLKSDAALAMDTYVPPVVASLPAPIRDLLKPQPLPA
jgi:hypothetical protein